MKNICGWLLGLGLITLVGCADVMSPPETVSDNATETATEAVVPRIVMRVDVATPAECAFGGSVTRAGIDSNRNGKLDDKEVAAQSVVCTPESVPPPPPVVLVRYLTGGTADGHCPAGGIIVQAGVDANGSGNLDDNEIEHTDYLCTGGAGLIGASR